MGGEDRSGTHRGRFACTGCLVSSVGGHGRSSSSGSGRSGTAEGP